jgi:LacI family transcriptional regulator
MDPELVVEGDLGDASGYRSGEQLLRKPRRVTAIFVCDGAMTLGVMQALKDQGLRCPEDIAVASFDDLPTNRPVRPQITAVVRPSYEIGAKAAKILIDRIEGGLQGDPVIQHLAPKLVIRESTSSTRPAGIGERSRHGVAKGPLLV